MLLDWYKYKRLIATPTATTPVAIIIFFVDNILAGWTAGATGAAIGAAGAATRPSQRTKPERIVLVEHAINNTIIYFFIKKPVF